MAVAPEILSNQEINKIITAPGSPLETHYEVTHLGIPMLTYKRMFPNVRTVWERTKAYADRTYLVFEDERYTYGQVREKVQALANSLYNEFGVRKGDRVAVIMRNYPEWIITFWATQLLGAVSVPINAWLTTPELEYCLSDSGTKVAIIDGERAEKITPFINSLSVAVIVTRTDKSWPGMLGLADVLARNAGAKGYVDVEIGLDDNATILYTSGTTGKPKVGALGSHRNFLVNEMNRQAAAIRAALRSGMPVPVPNPNVQSCTLLSVPLFHATGLVSILQECTVNGGKLVLMYKWDIEKSLKLIQREKVNRAGGVPTMVHQILDHPDRDNYDLSSLQGLSYGGAPPGADLVARIKRKWPAVGASNGYGLTETSAGISANTGPDYVRKPDSCGPPSPVNFVRIVDVTTGKDLPSGEIGELWIRGPNVVKGYWNKPEATKEAFLEGPNLSWFRSGDLAEVDKDGWIYIRDRFKDMIIRGGENIYSAELEDAAYSFGPVIIDAAAFGIPHPVLGEEVAMVVTVSPSKASEVSKSNILNHMRKRLAPFKIPVYLEVRTEMLERNANGKIIKKDLKVEVSKRWEAEKLQQQGSGLQAKL
ncbi:hypothetical protein SmJEL517_g01187 [Synchytrium microbalum]|uniref:AMP-dependent synthetase/ligase domain-containing protein n=1 Tax=Synchytrium microbalum TaxID=1806994 RepID=A0A507CAZ2_9FUNG|nr:uncharacterized protein SmJEL517_g01187 [Synchytrium microbalum]TPX36518.1 hypothetical protein SmJEL517_g01187 [Synchytrium microbalum]